MTNLKRCIKWLQGLCSKIVNDNDQSPDGELTHYYQYKWQSTSHSRSQVIINTKSLVIINTKRTASNLVGKIMILFLLLSFQCIPPLAKDLAHRPVVEVWMSLVDKRSVAFTEYHERIHRSSDVVMQAVFCLQSPETRSAASHIMRLLPTWCLRSRQSHTLIISNLEVTDNICGRGLAFCRSKKYFWQGSRKKTVKTVVFNGLLAMVQQLPTNAQKAKY